MEIDDMTQQLAPPPVRQAPSFDTSKIIRNRTFGPADSYEREYNINTLGKVLRVALEDLHDELPHQVRGFSVGKGKTFMYVPDPRVHDRKSSIYTEKRRSASLR